MWLEQNQQTSTAAYLAAPVQKKPAPWRVSGVLDPLKKESHGKCIYCEAFVDDVSYSAVEHIRPKSVFPELVLDWTNLGLACQRCNTNKGDFWTEDIELQLLNPYVDLVADHLEFIGPLVVAADESSRGVNTIRKLKLERDELVLSRMKRIQDVDFRIRLRRRESRPDYKQLLAEDVLDALDQKREFSASLRAFATLRGFDA